VKIPLWMVFVPATMMVVWVVGRYVYYPLVVDFWRAVRLSKRSEEVCRGDVYEVAGCLVGSVGVLMLPGYLVRLFEVPAGVVLLGNILFHLGWMWIAVGCILVFFISGRKV